MCYIVFEMLLLNYFVFCRCKVVLIKIQVSFGKARVVHIKELRLSIEFFIEISVTSMSLTDTTDVEIPNLYH